MKPFGVILLVAIADNFELLKSGKDTQVACERKKRQRDQNKTGKELEEASGQPHLLLVLECYEWGREPRKGEDYYFDRIQLDVIV